MSDALNLLYDLPEVLITECIGYCDANTISQLDSATTNKIIRFRFLLCITYVKEAMEQHEHSTGSLEYISLRVLRKVKSIKISRRNIHLLKNLLVRTGPRLDSNCNWEAFDFMGCQIDDTHLSSLSQACGDRLKHLNLSVCKIITDAGVIALCKECPFILDLDLSITHKAHITDRSLIDGVAGHLTHLTSLSLSHCYSITNKCILPVMNACPNLRFLDLTWCSKLSDIALSAISSGKCSTTLRELIVSDCTKVTSAGLVSLSSKCLNLERLVLNYCVKVSDSGIVALSKGCRRIACLELNNCILLTDVGISAIGFYCNKMESLKLANCVNLTDASAMALATGCPKLRRLGLFMVLGITNEGKMGLVRSCLLLIGKDFTAIRKSLSVLERFTTHASRKRATSPESRADMGDAWARAQAHKAIKIEF